MPPRKTVKPVVDTIAPTVNIVKPSTYVSVERGKNLDIAGTASDTQTGVGKIEVKLGGGAYQLANGTDSWSISLKIPLDYPLGGATFSVRAADKATTPNVSPAITKSFTVTDIPAEPIITMPADEDVKHCVNKHPFSFKTEVTQLEILQHLKRNGINGIRARVYMDNWVNNPQAVRDYVKETAEAADAVGIKILWTFGMQYEISSLFGGKGFHSTLVSGVIGSVSNYTTILDAKKAFMRKFYDNALYNGKPLWDHFAEYQLDLVNIVKNYKSSEAFMVYNEPMIYERADVNSIRNLNQYIGNKIVAVMPTAKIVVNHRHRTGVDVPFWDLTDIKNSIPTISNGKVVYSAHVYFEPDQDMGWMENTFKGIQSAINIPFWITEWSIRTISPMDASKMKIWIDKCLLNKWRHYLFTYDGSVGNIAVSHCCVDNNYVELPRKIWTAFMTALGRTSQGTLQ